jgi:hypothetical protein
MHKPEVYRAPGNRSDPHHWEWLQEEHDHIIYMQDVDPLVPSSRRYPIEAIRDGYLSGNSFFLSSIDYALALGIYQEYDEIHIYGIEMSSNTEYHYQRDGLRVWFAVAYTLGIDVYIHSQLNVFDTPDYGYGGQVTVPMERHDEAEADHRARWDTMQLERPDKLNALDTNNIHKLGRATSALVDFSAEAGKEKGLLDEHARYKAKLIDKINQECAPFIDRQEYEGAAGRIKDEIPKLQEMMFRQLGVIDYMAKVYNETGDKSALENIRMLARQAAELAFKMGHARGVYEVNHQLAGELDLAIRASGGQKAVAMLVGE